VSNSWTHRSRRRLDADRAEEIFGPVLVVIGYEDEDDAVRIANDSEFGLSGGVWSADEAPAPAVARRIRTGTVTVNGASIGFDGPVKALVLRPARENLRWVRRR
jgi:acyl-CoA reductase-like NAD-dependent aldehyde dehydrogenase